MNSPWMMNDANHKDIQSSNPTLRLRMAKCAFENAHNAVIEQTFEKCSARLHLKILCQIA
jgi:hypothetical protein